MTQKLPDVMPLQQQIDDFKVDQYYYGVNKDSTLGIVGMYADDRERIDDPEY